MTKAILASLPLFALLAWAGAALTQPAPDLANYYPLAVGNQWVYQVVDLKAPQSTTDTKRTVVIEVEREETYVRPKMNVKDPKDKDKEIAVPETKFKGYILKSTSGGKTTRDHVVVMEDGVYRVHSAGTQISPPLLIMKAPDMLQGKPWDANSTSGNTTIKGAFTPRLHDVKTAKDETVKVLVISFQDMQPGDDAVKIDTWFMPNVGMAQQNIKTKNHEILMKLENFTPAKK